jgi:hypothetical protein
MNVVWPELFQMSCPLKTLNPISTKIGLNHREDVFLKVMSNDPANRPTWLLLLLIDHRD